MDIYMKMINSKNFSNDEIAQYIARKENLTIRKIQKGRGLEADKLNKVIENGYKKKNKQDSNIDGYILDKSLSGERAQVYYNPETNKTVINHRGTASMKDWGTDLGLALGIKSGKRFKHAEKVQKQAEQKYKNTNITTTGHSLGSALALKASKNKKNEIISVNGAIMPHDFKKANQKNHYNVKASNDAVNSLYFFNKDKNKKNNTVIKTNNKLNLLKEHNSSNLNLLGNKYIGKR